MLNRKHKKSTDIIATLKQKLGNSIEVFNIVMDLVELVSIKKAAAVLKMFIKLMRVSVMLSLRKFQNKLLQLMVLKAN